MAVTELKDTGNGESKKYLTDNYKTEQFTDDKGIEYSPVKFQGDEESGFTYKPRGNVATLPGRNPVFMGSTSPRFAIPSKDWSLWDAGFTGDNIQDLERFRAEQQPWIVKAGYTIGGGALSGLGTIIEDAGYLMDYMTYVNMFTDIDMHSQKSMNLFRALPSAYQQMGRGLKKSTEKNVMPVYQNLDPNSFSDQVFQWNTLKTIIDNAVGFAVTGWGIGQVVNVAGKGIVKGLTKIGKNLAKVAETPAVLSELSIADRVAIKLSRTEAYAKLLSQRNPELFSTMDATFTGIFTKSVEGRMEGMEAYENYLEQYKPLVQNGVITQEELEQMASKEAGDVFDVTQRLFALDAMILKGLAKGKVITSKKLANPNFFRRNAHILSGIPKESTEEAIQQIAQMEGEYGLLQQTKNLQPGNYNKMKELGFDPDELLERYSERLAEYLLSNEVLVAASIGGISGPIQSAAFSMFDRKSRIKNIQDAYKDQQEQYKTNDKLFKATVEFKEKAKQLKLTDDMEEVSQLLGDKELQSIKEDATLAGIALDNFRKGTSDNLKQTLKESKDPEVSKLLPKLENLEKDYISSKKYINADRVFQLQNGVRLLQELLDNNRLKSNDVKLDEKTRTSYIKSANELENIIAKANETIDKETTKDYQIKLAESVIQMEKINKLVNSIAKVEDISALNTLKTLNPNLSDVIDDRIDQIRSTANLSKTTNTEDTKQNIQTKTRKSTPDNSTIEGKLDIITSKIANSVELTEEEIKLQKENIETIKDKLSNLHMQEETSENDVVDNEGTAYTESSGIEVKNKRDFDNVVKPVITELYKNLSENKDFNLNYNDVEDELYNYYLNIVDTVEDVNQLNDELTAKAEQLYKEHDKTSRLKDEIEIEAEEEIDANKSNEFLFSKSANKLVELLNLDKDLSSELTEDIISPEQQAENDAKAKVGKQILDTFKSMWKEMIQAGIEVEDFSTFIQAFQAAVKDPIVVREWFTNMAGFHQGMTGEVNTITYDDIFKTAEPDVVVDEMTNEKRQFIFETISPSVIDFLPMNKIYEIYMDETIEVVGSKNRYPASSIAYLSKAYEFKYIDNKTVTKESVSDDYIHGNPILNPIDYNAGTPLKIESADGIYKGRIRLENGQLIDWEEIKKASLNSETWDKFQQSYKLGKYSGKKHFNEFDIFDYWPLTIKHGETGQLIGFVHNTQWINHITSADSVIDSNRLALGKFRKDLISYLLENPETPFETKIVKKVIERKDDHYVGFRLLSKNKAELANKYLDPSISFGIMNISSVEVPGRASIENNILNTDEVEQFYSGTSFAFIPLGEVNGKMKYHASPLVTDKLPQSIIKSLRQSIEIFAKQDSSINQLLYDSYKKDGIDLLSKKGLSDVFTKVITLYNPKEKGTLAKTLKSRLGKSSLGFIEFSGETLSFGKSHVYSIFKGQKDLDTNLDILETQILPHVFFNVNKNLLNKTNKFTFASINDSNEIDTFEGNYNEFIKNYVSTFMRSVKLEDGTTAYTAQNITVFDMDTSKLNKLEIEETNVETIQETIPEGLEISSVGIDVKIEDLLKNPILKSISEKSGKDINKLALNIAEGKITLERLVRALNISQTALENNENKNCDS